MGNQKFTLENECLRVVASDKGGELQSVYDKQAQRELLWQGDARYWEIGRASCRERV